MSAGHPRATLVDIDQVVSEALGVALTPDEAATVVASIRESLKHRYIVELDCDGRPYTWNGLAASEWDAVLRAADELHDRVPEFTRSRAIIQAVSLCTTGTGLCNMDIEGAGS